jgi:chromosome segregation ATPase
MHTFSLFLFSNWLPVGISAIAFFGVGLLLAKFIWGGYSGRLHFAVEENLNLAGQWNSLGVSQRDLFKKLRVRWQQDRMTWDAKVGELEGVVRARDERVGELTRTLQNDGQMLVGDQEQSEIHLRRIAELEKQLAEQKLVEQKHLAGTLDATPATILGDSEEGLQQRIRDLEQDLIDTHDELHDVRDGFRKQVEMVETLEAQLIAQPALGVVGEDAATNAALVPGQVVQLTALLAQRTREIRSLRESVANEVTHRPRHVEAAAGVGVNPNLERKFQWLSEELSNSTHEMFDVRSALVGRLDEISLLEGRLDELDGIEQQHDRLAAQLADTVAELVDVRTALHRSLEEIANQERRWETRPGGESDQVAFAQGISDARHEMSDVRLALNEAISREKVLLAQKEELEAAMEDQSTEVSGLANELRNQRDLVAKLREAMAEQQGELDAVRDEATFLTQSINAKGTYAEEQAQRVVAVEASLSQFYGEMNQVRMRCDQQTQRADTHLARVRELEEEMQQRQADFDRADSRVERAEAALMAARAQVEEVTNRLHSSDQAISELTEELGILSRERVQHLRELDETIVRVQTLQAEAQQREEALGVLRHTLDIRETEAREATQASASAQTKLGNILETNRSLELTISEQIALIQERDTANGELQRHCKRLETEMSNARQAADSAVQQIVGLEDALSQGETKTLALSRHLVERETEIRQLEFDLSGLRHKLNVKDGEADASGKTGESSHLGLRIHAARSALAASIKAPAEDLAQKNQEIETLKSELRALEQRSREFGEQRQRSIDEVERLRLKVAERAESIRELQSQISSVMLQRSSRDSEIALLKDKLRALESKMLDSNGSNHASGSIGQGSSLDLAAALVSSLEAEQGDSRSGTHLDEVPEPAPVNRLAGEPAGTRAGAVPVAQVGGVLQVHFAEGSAELSVEERARLDDWSREARTRSRMELVSVLGFAGAEGPRGFVESLSARRAEAVRERLLERGIPQHRMTVRSAGQDTTTSEEDSRRVELSLVAQAVAERVN